MTYGRLEEILNQRLSRVVTSGGTVLVKVNRVNSAKDPERPNRMIGNINVLTPDLAEKIIDLFKKGGYEEAYNVGSSFNFRSTDEFAPTAGSMINATFGMVSNREKTGEILRVVGIAPPPKAQVAVYSLTGAPASSEQPVDSGSSPADYGSMDKNALLEVLVDEELLDSVDPSWLTSTGKIKASATQKVAEFLQEELG